MPATNAEAVHRAIAAAQIHGRAYNKAHRQLTLKNEASNMAFLVFSEESTALRGS
jgi:hypothetical protein